MAIGVLALQGDFQEHINKLSGMNVPAVEVRLPADLDGCSGLIIPGGETTTFRNLAEAFGMIGPLREFGKRRALWGTCAGAIVLARDIGRGQSVLGVMDITVERNAFGRQRNSFEIDLEIPVLPPADPPAFHAIFIRAPAIVRAGKGVTVLARLPDGTIVAAREKNCLATCFHPELTADDRIHRLFLDMVKASG
jgi:5'-phosphate synthase pdxT subunit